MIDRRTFIAATAATAAAPGVAAPLRSGGAFPEGFLWGAATAAHQVEGNNVNSDCWALEHVTPTVFAEPSGDAANSFQLWPTDLDLVRNMGLNSYRFSLEWARIEPEPGAFSTAMLDHYKAMIEGCRARGLTPMVTFNHFTTPRWFAARGGWTAADSPQLFARYCERAARHLAGSIGYATTLNEPNLAGLLQEVLPPTIGPRLVAVDKAMSEAAARKFDVPLFYAGNGLYAPDPAVVRRNLLAGHAAGRAAIKAVRGDLPVGVSLAMLDEQAAPGGERLRDAARERLYAPWLRAARGDEFVGVQNYERNVWGPAGKLPAPAGAVRNYAGNEVYAGSLAGTVRYAHSVAGVPVIVTEHGVGTDDDRVRAALIPAALAELRKAMAGGVPVKGYVHWSLVDNFEWVFGYKPKFGLHSLDRTTFKRTPKPSVSVYSAIARRNAV
ncbi:glycoside hydrolase family 1 protein [Sphingomonas ginkgonis]|uniref:Glycoside hydrolase family 1 protein n=1 Tax=Sphingomonas ginkgonis TaxID=2315330 RepID=A0A3R9YII6_9SPHN|nr:family 1 glycosylhydrolase [Sphingomonas ginkgonis]RST30650.1 glycoside hydrolase family 1 protein [Sphingomonas ginkgonis]